MWLSILSCVTTLFPNTSDLCVLKYETLIQPENTLTELGRCLDFLGFPLTKKRIECLLENLEGAYHR